MQMGHSFEVVVVDDASSDRTAAIAHDHGARVIAVSHRQIAATRNAGARQASGEMFVFLDADTVVNEAVIGAAFRATKQGAAGGGCAVRFDGRLPFYGRAFVAVMAPLYRVLRLASGCFLFCTPRGISRGRRIRRAAVRRGRGGDESALRRQGRFVVLREFVVTSGRKFRAHTAPKSSACLRDSPSVGRNQCDGGKVGLWYGERRSDPDSIV